MNLRVRCWRYSSTNNFSRASPYFDDIHLCSRTLAGVKGCMHNGAGGIRCSYRQRRYAARCDALVGWVGMTVMTSFDRSVEPNLVYNYAAVDLLWNKRPRYPHFLSVNYVGPTACCTGNQNWVGHLQILMTANDWGRSIVWICIRTKHRPCVEC
jgi:hypothetical protein